jgi:predicted nucleotidyltransferase
LILGAVEAAVRELRHRSVPHALIGAAAMAAHGVLRSTDDMDLLATDRSVLHPDFWKSAADQGFAVSISIGDDEDRLAGGVKLEKEGARSLDVVVGRHRWQAEILERAEPFKLGRIEMPLVLASDLILLKLFAGARQDILDAEAILDGGDRRRLEAEVNAHIGRLPKHAREAWRDIGPKEVLDR